MGRSGTGMWVSGGSGDMVKYRLFHPKPVQVRHRGHFSKAIHLIKIAAVIINIKNFFHFELCFFLECLYWGFGLDFFYQQR